MGQGGGRGWRGEGRGWDWGGEQAERSRSTLVMGILRQKNGRGDCRVPARLPLSAVRQSRLEWALAGIVRHQDGARDRVEIHRQRPQYRYGSVWHVGGCTVCVLGIVGDSHLIIFGRMSPLDVLA